jgi:dTDP-4-dehydrorhamnose 3,5-epimerase
MQTQKTAIPDVLLIVPDVYEDERGFFMETYQSQKFRELGIREEFVQDNHSHSQQGVLRGLHYQVHHPQGKLIRVVAGEVFDVVVDIRKSSRTFGKWFGKNLSAENKMQMWVPPGFAHGYYVLSEWADFIYKTTDFYYPKCERVILWNDEEISINWPLLEGKPPLVSAKDNQGKSITKAELFD